MPERLGDALLELRTDNRRLDQGIRRGKRSAQDLDRSFDRTSRSVVASANRMGAALAAAFGTAAIGSFIADSVRAATAAEELRSAFRFSFGEAADDVEQWAEQTGNALGRATSTIQQNLFEFNQLFKTTTDNQAAAADLSKQFTLLAQDLGSFFNVAESDALLKLRSGLVGESEPLRRFGVFLNEASVQSKALELGLGGVSGELTDQQKILARAAIILEQTADAQGDLVRTADSAANRQRRLTEQIKEQREELGQRLLPTYGKLLNIVSEVVEGFNALIQIFDIINAKIAEMSGGFVDLAEAIKLPAKQVELYIDLLAQLFGLTRAPDTSLEALAPPEIVERLRAMRDATQAIADAARTVPSPIGEVARAASQPDTAPTPEEGPAVKLLERLREETRALTLEVGIAERGFDDTQASLARIVFDAGFVDDLSKLPPEAQAAAKEFLELRRRLEELESVPIPEFKPPVSRKEIEATVTFTDALGQSFANMASPIRLADSLAVSFVGNLSSGLTDALFRTNSLQDGFFAVARAISEAVAQAVLFAAISRGLGFAFGGFGGGVPITQGTALFGGPGPTLLQSGGVFGARRPFIAGEHGAELVVPEVGGRVFSASDTSRILSGASGSRGGDVFIDARGADQAAIARLERVIATELAPGRIERRAVAATVNARRRDPSLFGASRP